MWSHDYCTVCDKQCPSGSMYCSDACRSCEQAACTNVSSASDSLYSTLYTTGRHHSLSTPSATALACKLTHPLCETGNCVCQYSDELRKLDLSDSEQDREIEEDVWLSPALTVSSSPAVSIQSDFFRSFAGKNRESNIHSLGGGTPTPPLSPSLMDVADMEPRTDPLTMQPLNSPVAEEKIFVNTSVNYRKWLSATSTWWWYTPLSLKIPTKKHARFKPGNSKIILTFTWKILLDDPDIT